MNFLNTFDYGVIAVYFLILVGLGIYLKSKASASLEDYFIGGRRIPWWALGISGMASYLDIAGTVVIVSMIFLLGPRGLYIAFRGGAVLILAFCLVWMGKWHRRSGCITRAEWMIFRFGDGPGGRCAQLIAALFSIVWCVGMIGYLVIAVGIFLSTFLPFSPFMCALMLLGVATVYTMVSGFYGVVFTDIFQALIIFAAVILVSVLGYQKVTEAGGVAQVAQVAEQVTGNDSWTSGIPNWKTSMPEGYKGFEYLAIAMLIYFFRTFLGGMGQCGQDPKYFGARNDRECGTLTFLWTWLMMFRWPMMMGFAILGIFLVQKNFPDQKVLGNSEIAIKRHIISEKAPEVQIDFAALESLANVQRRFDWDGINAKIVANSFDPKKDADLMARLKAYLGNDWRQKFAALYQQEQKVKELVPKTSWSTILSKVTDEKKYPALAAELKSALGPAGADGMGWKNKLDMLSYEGTPNPEKVLSWVLLYCIPQGFRGLMLVALIAASMSTFDSTINMTTGLFTRDIYQKFIRPKAKTKELIYTSWIFIFVLVAIGFVFAYSIKNINDIWEWIIMGLLGGLLVPEILRLYWSRFNGWGFAIGTFAGGFAAILQRYFLPDLGGQRLFLFVSAIGLTGSILGTYLTKPTDDKVLENFYRKTRPFGFWAQCRKKLTESEWASMKREHINDWIALPFTLMWQISLFMAPMLFVVQAMTAFWVTMAFFAVGLGGMIVFWYRKLPAENVVT
ncbi:MAG: sodium:solute symporter [Planctomycetes bacterium]|nr:sodium:solute symporter [Planctomycetota bacterium]